MDPFAAAAWLVLATEWAPPDEIGSAPASAGATATPITREVTGPSEVPAPPEAEAVEPAVAPTAVVAPAGTSSTAPGPAAPPRAAKPTDRYAKWERKFGGFAEVDLQLTTLDDSFATIVGGGAGFILLDRIVVGAAGYGLVYHDERYRNVEGDRRLRMAWGGPTIGVYAVRRKMVESSATWLLAGGRACLNFTIDDTLCDESTDVFVSQVEFDVYLKVAKILRLGVGIGYRFVGATDWDGPGDWDLAGGYGSFKVALGRFDQGEPKSKKSRRPSSRRR